MIESIQSNSSNFGNRKLKLKDTLFLNCVFSVMEVYFSCDLYKSYGTFSPLVVVLILLLFELLSFIIFIPKHYFKDYSNLLNHTAVFGVGHSLVFGLIFIYAFGNRINEKIFVFVCWLVLVAVEVVILEALRRKHMKKKFNEAKFKKIFIPLVFLFLVFTKTIRETILDFAPLIMSLCLVPFYVNFFLAKEQSNDKD